MWSDCLRKSSLYFLSLPQVLNFPKSNHKSQTSNLKSQRKVVPLHPVRVRWGRAKCVRTYAASRKKPLKYNKKECTQL